MTQLQLQPISGHKKTGPIVTVILDGVGLGPSDESNGVYSAYSPVLDTLMRERLFTQLKAHGVAVGLPTDGDMGNSEVGHNALGAGRIFSQGAKLVNEAISSGSLYAGESWREIINKSKNGGTIHFIGMISDGNVHSHIRQLYSMIERCIVEGVSRIRIHGLLDGRDVGQKSALDYFVPLEEKLKEVSVEGRDYRIASGGGRMVTTMDRYEANWDVVENGWRAHVLGEGRQFLSASEAIETYYAEDPEITDQYMDSFVIAEEGKPIGTIEDGDGVIFFNFRGDRAIELSRAFDEDDFTPFNRIRRPDVFYAGMMQYDGDALIPKHYLVNPPSIDRTLGEYLCGTGISSYAISETQKYGHVTYFWNGNKSGYIDRKFEQYIEIPSDRVSFDLRPWMKAAEITESVVSSIEGNKYQFIRVNLANGDMVGHTGVVAAVRIAVETVDMCLGRIASAVKKAGGILVVTADHGNADCMWTKKNGQTVPMVAHTKNPVPFVIKDYSENHQFEMSEVENPGLANVAATLCILLGYKPPSEYEPSLVKHCKG